VDLQQKLKEEKIQSVLSNIKLGHFDKAKGKYEELEDTSEQLLERIVKETYSPEMYSAGFGNIVRFTNTVGTFQIFDTVVPILHEQMCIYNHLEFPPVLFFKLWM